MGLHLPVLWWLLVPVRRGWDGQQNTSRREKKCSGSGVAQGSGLGIHAREGCTSSRVMGRGCFMLGLGKPNVFGSGFSRSLLLGKPLCSGTEQAALNPIPGSCIRSLLPAQCGCFPVPSWSWAGRNREHDRYLGALEKVKTNRPQNLALNNLYCPQNPQSSMSINHLYQGFSF